MTLICQACDQHAGSLHLDSCPLRMTGSIGGSIVTAHECVRVEEDTHEDR